MTQAERDWLVALKKAKKKPVTQRQAAEDLGIAERQVRRLLRALKRRGDKAVVHVTRVAIQSLDQCRHRTEGGGNSVQAGVPGIWADAGCGIPGPETRHRGEPGDGVTVDGSKRSCGEHTSKASRRSTYGVRDAAVWASWWPAGRLKTRAELCLVQQRLGDSGRGPMGHQRARLVGRTRIYLSDSAPGHPHRSAGAIVRVEKRHEGSVAIRFRDRYLGVSICDQRPQLPPSKLLGKARPQPNPGQASERARTSI